MVYENYGQTLAAKPVKEQLERHSRKIKRKPNNYDLCLLKKVAFIITFVKKVNSSKHDFSIYYLSKCLNIVLVIESVDCIAKTLFPSWIRY